MNVAPQAQTGVTKRTAGSGSLGLIRGLDMLILVTAALQYIWFWLAQGQQVTGYIFMIMQFANLPAAFVVWLVTMLLGRSRDVPASHELLATATFAAMVGGFVLPWPTVGVWLGALLTAGGIALAVAMPFRNARPRWPDTRTFRAVQAALIGVALTAVMIVYEASPLQLDVNRIKASLGLGDPMLTTPSHWIGLCLFLAVLFFLDKASSRQALERIGLSRLAGGVAPAAVILVGAMPSLFFAHAGDPGGTFARWAAPGLTVWGLLIQVAFFEGFYRGYVLRGIAGAGRWQWAPGVVLATALPAALPLHYLLSIDPVPRMVAAPAMVELALSAASGLILVAAGCNLLPSLALRLVSPLLVRAIMEGSPAVHAVLAGWLVVTIGVAWATRSLGVKRAPATARPSADALAARRSGGSGTVAGRMNGSPQAPDQVRRG